MKITIEGSPKEVAELLNALPNGAGVKVKKPYFPPLLTKLTEDEKINELAEAIRNTDEENAPQVEAAEQEVPFLVRDLGNRGRRNHFKQTSCEPENQTNDNN